MLKTFEGNRTSCSTCVYKKAAIKAGRSPTVLLFRLTFHAWKLECTHDYGIAVKMKPLTKIALRFKKRGIQF